MAYSRLSGQDTLNTSATTSVTTTYAKPTAVGNLLVATLFAGGVGLGTPTISGWTSAVSVSFLSAADACAIFYKVADGTEAGIVASCSGASSMVLAIHEFSEGALMSLQTWVDKTNSNNTATPGTTLTTGSVTPTKPRELIVAVMSFPTGGTSAWSWDNGLTTMSSNVNLTDGFLLDQNIAAINPAATWTGASTSGGCIASFFAGSQCDTLNPHVIVGNGVSRGSDWLS